jgi:hypothetical protein
MLASYTFRLLKKCEANVLKNRWEHLDDVVIRDRRQRLLDFHGNFLQECEALSRDLRCSANRQDYRASLLLQMHAIPTKTLLSICMSQDVEAAFDLQIYDFKRIVTLAKLFVTDFSRGDPRQSTLPSLSTDWGIVFPLVTVVTKCRHPAIRREALGILDSWKLREGFWDPSLAATYAHQVIKLEGPDRSCDEVEPSKRAKNLTVDIGEEQADLVLSWEWEGDESGAEPTRNTLEVKV